MSDRHEFMNGRAVVTFGEWLGSRIEYEFHFDGKLLFSGSDFKPSPMLEANGRESAVALLGFLTLQKGDTDDEFFANHTPEQTAWAESYECELLSCEISDEEQRALSTDG